PEEILPLARGGRRDERAEDLRVVEAEIEALARVLVRHHQEAAEVPADVLEGAVTGDEAAPALLPPLQDQALQEACPLGESDQIIAHAGADPGAVPELRLLDHLAADERALLALEILQRAGRAVPSDLEVGRRHLIVRHDEIRPLAPADAQLGARLKHLLGAVER